MEEQLRRDLARVFKAHPIVRQFLHDLQPIVKDDDDSPAIQKCKPKAAERDDQVDAHSSQS